jgi:hypothetical protein
MRESLSVQVRRALRVNANVIVFGFDPVHFGGPIRTEYTIFEHTVPQ